MSAVSSSSTRKPIETTSQQPGADRLRRWGMIFLRRRLRRRRADLRRPSMRGTEKPQMSASSTPTVKPVAASAAARLTVTDDLPTPPLPEAIMRTRVVAGPSVSGAFVA